MLTILTGVIGGIRKEVWYVVAALVACAIGVVYLENQGRQKERSAQVNKAIKTLKEQNELERKIDDLSDDDLRKRMRDRWRDAD